MEATESIQMFAERIMRYDSKKVVQMMRTVHEPTARSILACRLMMDKTPEVVAVPTVTFEKSRKALNAYMGYRCTYFLTIPYVTLTDFHFRLLQEHAPLRYVADEEDLVLHGPAVGAGT
jgi:hypothetical protein